MCDFLKNYIIGGLLLLLYTPLFLLWGLLVILPGILIAYPLSLVLPASTQTLTGIVALALSIYICTSWEPYRKLLQKVLPSGISRDD